MTISYLQVHAFVWLCAVCGLVPNVHAQSSEDVEVVSVVRPKTISASRHVESTGTFEASATVTIVARVDGILEAVHFKDGASVDQGQLLFSIERDTYQQQLDLRQAQLERAQAEYERQQRLAAKDATDQQDVETWLARRNEGTASTNLAKINLGYTEVKAPFAGQMGRHLVDPGNLVGPESGTTKLAVLSRVDPIYLYFSINSPDAVEIRRQMLAQEKRGTQGDAQGGAQGNKIPVQVALGKAADFRYQGKLDFVDTGFDESTGTIQLRAVLNNPDGTFIPGLFARVRVAVGDPEPRLAIPNRAVQQDQAGPYVLVVDAKDVVRRKRIQSGGLEGRLRLVAGGLQADDRVIVNGLAYARSGQKVSVKEAQQ